MLIDDLKAIQKRHGYLPREELASLSKDTGVPLYQLHGVASFYPHFRLMPLTSTEVRVCTDLSCYMRGSPELLDFLGRASDNQSAFTVTECACLGQCDRAPAIAFGGDIHTLIDENKLTPWIDIARKGGVPAHERMRRARPTTEIDPDAPYSMLKRMLNGSGPSPDDVIAILKDSGIRGMGGAGFPAGAKWEIVRKAVSGSPAVPWWDARKGFVPAEKYVICNADESEPGTFKDRDLMRRAPHRVIEGMLIAALVVGATECIVYIRHEYDREGGIVERELRKVRKILKEHRSPIHATIFESPGGYICGEETALLEALEGKRAEPRNKPPFPGTHGLFGKPTVINNVETFAWIPAILHHGADWFRSQGVNGGSGLKCLALSGDVRKPGVYQVPLGIPAKELIEVYGRGVATPGSRKKKLKALMPGGASSGFLPSSMIDVPLEFRALAQVGSMLGSGAVVAIAEGRCMLDLALNVTRFFRNESCGKCVPCREGTKRIVEILEHARLGDASIDDVKRIDELSEAMQLTSICGLGQAAPLPITSVLKYFREEVDSHIVEKKCPEGVCFR